MTNDDLEQIYKQNSGVSHLTALRAVYTQGWYEGAGQTPVSVDKSVDVAKPTVIVRFIRRIG